MKKIIAMLSITMLLALSGLGQQTPTVAPAQTPTPAAKGKATKAKPVAVAPAQQSTPTKASAPVVAPAAEAKVTSATPVAARPGQATMLRDVDSPVVAPVPAAEATPTSAAQIAPATNARITPTAQAPAIATPTPQTVPAIAAQASTIGQTPEPRINSARPAATSLTGQQSNVSTTAPSARTPEYIEEKGFKGKVFEVKYRTPDSLVNALSALGSGFKGATIRPNEEFKTITVRDFPENIAAIEEAIKRLDTPQAPRPDLEFRIQVLIASNVATQGEEYPADLNEVVKQLQSTFKYKNYGLMFTSTHRTKAGGAGVNNNGVAESKLFNVSVPAGNQIFYDYNISQINLDNPSSGGTTVQLGVFQFSLRIPLMLGNATDPKIQYQNVGFRSPVSLREGEKVVVGTTTMGDKGLIVVLTAKVNK
jgi:hypothetical protein